MTLTSSATLFLTPTGHMTAKAPDILDMVAAEAAKLKISRVVSRFGHGEYHGVVRVFFRHPNGWEVYVSTCGYALRTRADYEEQMNDDNPGFLVHQIVDRLGVIDGVYWGKDAYWVAVDTELNRQALVTSPAIRAVQRIVDEAIDKAMRAVPPKKYRKKLRAYWRKIYLKRVAALVRYSLGVGASPDEITRLVGDTIDLRCLTKIRKA